MQQKHLAVHIDIVQIYSDHGILRDALDGGEKLRPVRHPHDFRLKEIEILGEAGFGG